MLWLRNVCVRSKEDEAINCHGKSLSQLVSLRYGLVCIGIHEMIVLVQFDRWLMGKIERTKKNPEALG
jgi:hypothetical protein